MSIDDEHLRQIFVAMETKLQTSSRQLASLRAQVQVKERERRISELSAKELDQYPEASTVAYKSVGRMFLQSNLKSLKKGLRDRASENEKEIKAMQVAAKKLEKEAGDVERSIRDILEQRKTLESS
ncbi:hypothetical protein HK405_007662 [Cladochytrium tenue]|nr:hypothetical protein HK405_007662 [Cladochytrium tenue]